MSNRRFLLSRLVKEEIDRSSSTAFEDEIKAECQKLADSGYRIPDKDGKLTARPQTIDRRKLDRIAAADDMVNLHLWELRVLASYFERKHGLDLSETPVFEKVSIYDPLTHGRKVSFLFGLRPDASERVNSLRLWDLRSMTAIAEAAYQTGNRIELDWRFVDPAAAKGLESESKDCNLISIGSPRANAATEILLARMFGVPAFQAESSKVRPLPFSFVWPQPLRSTFATPIPSLRTLAGKGEISALEAGHASAMMIHGQVYVVDHTYTEAWIPGVIAAQRLLDGRVVVVIAGLSGPATLGAARLLRDLGPELPLASADPDHMAVLWMAVRVHVVAKADALADTREPDRWEPLTSPAVWGPAQKDGTAPA